MSSGKETMKHAAIYSGAAMMGKMISFLMLPFYAHILRGHGYAIIGMLDVGLSFLTSLVAYGVRGSIVRLFHDEKDPALKPVVVSTGVILIAVATVVLTVPFIIFAKPVSALLLGDANLYHLLILALVAFIFEMAGQGASAWLLIKSKSVKFAGINLLRLFVGLSLNIYLILIKGMMLDGYFISSLVTSAIVNSLLMFIVLRETGTVFNKEIARRILSFIGPLIPGAIISFVSRQMERILVRFQIGLESVGILEMGYKFPFLIVQLITTPFMQSWSTRRFEMADEEDAPKRIGAMFTYFFFLVTFVGLIMAVVIKPVLTLLTPPEFHLSYRMARIEIVTLILQGSYYHLTFGLFYAKHTAVIAKIRGWTSALKVLMAWIFISTWGIYGAAFSAAVTGAITLIAGFILAQRRYRLVLEWWKIGSIASLALAMFMVLSQWDASGWSFFGWITDQCLPWVNNSMDGTFLATVKDGKLPRVLGQNSDLIAEIVVKGLLSLPFALLLPAVNDQSRLRIKAAVRRHKR
jgi:O-antigen/teichoic acid export membrane protein